jgi:hypothetical protein
MNVLPRIPQYAVGEAGSAAIVEGQPAMLLSQQPDSMLDAGQVGPLTVRAGSVRGAGHRYDGSPRQDDLCFGTAGPNGEWLVVVVADGVSAGPRSHIAARVAVRLGVQLVSEALGRGGPEAINWDELIGKIAGHVLLQARKESGDPDLDARDASQLMATTVALVIMPVMPEPDGSRRCTVLPIGDTSVWILRAGGEWQSITAIKNAGEAVATSAVFALPLLPATSLVALPAVLSAGDALFAVTDGIGDPLGDGQGDVGAALAAAWAAPPNRFEFLAQVDFGRRSHTDDRTVVGVWPDRVEPGEPLPSSLTSGEPLPDQVDLARDHAAVPADEGRSSEVLSPPSELPPPSDLPPVSPLAPPERVTWQPTPWTPTPWKPDGSGRASE